MWIKLLAIPTQHIAETSHAMNFVFGYKHYLLLSGDLRGSFNIKHCGYVAGIADWEMIVFLLSDHLCGPWDGVGHQWVSEWRCWWCVYDWWTRQSVVIEPTGCRLNSHSVRPSVGRMIPSSTGQLATPCRSDFSGRRLDQFINYISTWSHHIASRLPFHV